MMMNNVLTLISDPVAVALTLEDTLAAEMAIKEAGGDEEAGGDKEAGGGGGSPRARRADPGSDRPGPGACAGRQKAER